MINDVLAATEQERVKWAILRTEPPYGTSLAIKLASEVRRLRNLISETVGQLTGADGDLLPFVTEDEFGLKFDNRLPDDLWLALCGAADEEANFHLIRTWSRISQATD